MRILFIARAVDINANFGDSVHVRELLRAWSGDRHFVDVLCTSTDATNGGAERSRLPMVRFHVVRTVGISRFYPIRQILAAIRALAVLKTTKPDVVYARPPINLSGTFDPLLEIVISWLSQAPLVLEINGWAEQEADIIRSSRFFAFRSANQLALRMWLRKVKGFVPVDEGLGERLKDEMSVDPTRIRVIQNGADPLLFTPGDKEAARRVLKLETRHPILVFVGYLGLEADLHGVIEAVPALADEFPGILLLVVGGGTDLLRYRDLARQFGAQDHVVFVGAVEHERVPTYVQASDVALVAMRRDVTTNPLKLYEYWCCAKPVVASDQASLQLVRNVGGGVIANGDGARGWIQAISTIVRSSAEAEEMGAKGREYVLAERTWSATAKRVISFLREIQSKP